ncbi:DgyrCDS3222 [Dimorphilus gyrociliatus]|uniref:DgyrCDS3222 n=1 Tax=Dimorphilus gyrociliatus TaxID=2664684 RepID=A0A7I8VHN0_9ANNE|nr:DgyrCDS3222 [Dimorphilus gyrociliatus]
MCFTLLEIVYRYIGENSQLVYEKYKDKKFRMPNLMAERILQMINSCQIGVDMSGLRLFHLLQSSIDSIKINGRRIDNPEVLSVFKNLPLKTFHIHCMVNVALTDWIDNIKDAPITDLSINGCLLSYGECQRESRGPSIAIKRLCHIKTIICLDVSFTKFNSECFQYVCSSLPNLEEFNIVATDVQNITSIVKLRNLRIFTTYLINTLSESGQYNLLRELPNLEGIYIKSKGYAGDIKPKSWLYELMNEKIWVNLKYFSIEGVFLMYESTVRRFLDNHPKLEYVFLGIYASHYNISYSSYYCHLSPIVYPKDIFTCIIENEEMLYYLTSTIRDNDDEVMINLLENIDKDNLWKIVNRDIVIHSLMKIAKLEKLKLYGYRLLLQLVGGIRPGEKINRDLLEESYRCLLETLEKNSEEARLNELRNKFERIL